MMSDGESSSPRSSFEGQDLIQAKIQNIKRAISRMQEADVLKKSTLESVRTGEDINSGSLTATLTQPLPSPPRAPKVSQQL